MKVNASYSVLNQDIDISDYYLYQGYYDMKGGWYTWADGQGGYTSLSKRGSNENLGFIKRKEWRVGLETSLLNGLVSLDFNYFHQLTDGLLTSGTATLYPSWMTGDGSFITSLNYNQDLRQGFDFAINLKKKLGKVDAQLGLTGQYLSTEAKRREENNEYSYLNAAGQTLNALRGYVCEGFFQSEEEIANSPKQTFGDVKPGDLKYKDINEDGVIDSK